MVKILKDPKAIVHLSDKYLGPLLDTLKDHPKTIEEISKDLGKSSKTIYRYLARLEKTDLVIPVGKRIIRNPNGDISTQSLFGRTAKIFYDGTVHMKIQTRLSQEESKKLYNEIFHTVCTLLSYEYNHASFDIGLLYDLSKEIDQKREKYAEKLLHNADADVINFLKNLNEEHVDYILRTVSLLSVMGEQNWEQRIKACFKQNQET